MAGVRTRRVTEFGMVAGCLAALVSACGTQHLGTSGTTSGIPRASAARPAGTVGKVAWVDRAAPVYTRAAVIPVQKAPAAKYAACASTDLTASDGDISMGTGRVADYIVLTNKGDKACTLSGGPSSLIGIRADGSRKALATGPAGQFGNLVGPANLQPGQSAQVAITTTYLCTAGEAGKTDEYTSVEIGLGGGDDQTKLSGQSHPLNAICGADVSDFGVPDTASDVVSSPLDVLTASAVHARPSHGRNHDDLPGDVAEPDRNGGPAGPVPVLRGVHGASRRQAGAGPVLPELPGRSGGPGRRIGHLRHPDNDSGRDRVGEVRVVAAGDIGRDRGRDDGHRLVTI